MDFDSELTQSPWACLSAKRQIATILTVFFFFFVIVFFYRKFYYYVKHLQLVKCFTTQIMAMDSYQKEKMIVVWRYKMQTSDKYKLKLIDGILVFTIHTKRKVIVMLYHIRTGCK